MYRTTYSSLQSSNTLNYRRMITHRASESVYCTTISAVNGLSRLTKLTTSKGQSRPIQSENFRIAQSLSNRIESDSRFEANLEA